ncbi:unnamed protein product [Moneuplotes crassus]|uniref:Uncharacterized protein n=1 Tax=Euplotes crassus TaxID=5936 RepID=A0AAD1XXA4_EUPCR|nr:unnamed protein product [Moneuplotes crassus]
MILLCININLLRYPLVLSSFFVLLACFTQNTFFFIRVRDFFCWTDRALVSGKSCIVDTNMTSFDGVSIRRAAISTYGICIISNFIRNLNAIPQYSGQVFGLEKDINLYLIKIDTLQFPDPL